MLELIAALDADGQKGDSLLANAIVDGSSSGRSPIAIHSCAWPASATSRSSSTAAPLLDGVPFVGIDDRAAAQAGAEHLLQLRHRAVAIISQPFGASRHARHHDAAEIGRPKMPRHP